MTNQQTHNPSFTMKVQDGSPSEATIVFEPLESGYGHTLGNALRRVLLSSLTGAALTSVRIEGVDHQFSAIEGVSEDVLEITLNLKQVRFRAEREGQGVVRLNITGPKTVTAGDLDPEAGFTVINKDQIIATVAKGKTLEMEMTVATGEGYQLADEQSSELGRIPMDALFSPVIRVSYTVQSTRVGRRTDFDKLILQVKTDGSILPEDAVVKSAEILVKQFTQIISPVIIEEHKPVSAVSPEEAEVLRLTVEELDLPTRIANALRKGGYRTVGDLVGAPKGVVAKVKNLGEKSVEVVDEALQKKGVSLGA